MLEGGFRLEHLQTGLKVLDQPEQRAFALYHRQLPGISIVTELRQMSNQHVWLCLQQLSTET